jgi:hypothetical protein
MQRRRIEPDVEQIQAIRTKQRTQRKKYCDKRKPRSLQHSRQKGRYDDHYSN